MSHAPIDHMPKESCRRHHGHCPHVAESLDQFMRMEALKLVEVLADQLDAVRRGLLAHQGSGFAMPTLAALTDQLMDLRQRLDSLP